MALADRGLLAARYAEIAPEQIAALKQTEAGTDSVAVDDSSTD